MTRSSDRYLWFRPQSKSIWFRMAVPKEYQELAGTKKVQHSLHTTDKSTARIKALKRRADLLEKWAAASPQRSCDSGAPSEHSVVPRSAPTLAELEEAAVAIAYDIPLEGFTNRRKSLPALGDAGWEIHVDMIRSMVARQIRLTATSDHHDVRAFADEAIDVLGFDLPRDSVGYLKFCEILNKVHLAALRSELSKVEGAVVQEVEEPVVNRVRDRDAKAALAGQTLVELFEKWAAECLAKKEKRLDTVNSDRKIIEQFSDFIGHKRAVDTVTPLEVAEYRDALRMLPPKWKSHKALKDLSMRDAATQARALKLPQTAFTTVNKHLSTISPLYKWLKRQPAWANIQNPCVGLNHHRVKGKNPRPPFSTSQLNAILQSPLFTGFKADGQEHLPGTQIADDWRKWIPLLCMFTGARIGEVAQLRVGDVRQEHGGWFLRIREDEALGLATKNRKDRPAALHSLLERMGFLTFHARQVERCSGNFDEALFPGIEPNARGQISASPSRWWRGYLLRIGLKENADGFGAHSFRHTFTDRLRSESELTNEEIGICLGHSQPSTTAGYGRLSPGTAKMLRGWIEGLSFEGVDFTHLFAT